MADSSQLVMRLLEASLQISGLTERELEERLGWPPGELGRMVDGATDCEPHQLLTILTELGAESGKALPSFQSGNPGNPMVHELIERFHALGYEPAEAPVSTTGPPAAEEIEKTVEDVLQRTFGDLRPRKRGGG